MLFQDLPASAAVLPKVDYDLPSNRADWNRLILVGEAPGKDEVKLGHPFVGRSGQLLNELLKEAGIERSRCLVANVFRFQPPGNKVDHFFTSKRAALAESMGFAEDLGQFGSVWCKQAFAPEVYALRRLIEEWRPALLVALGRTPFWALTGQNGLLNGVGQLFDCRLCPEIKVLPTFHPSFILRGNWAKRPEWLQHFVFATQYVAQR